MVKDEAKPFVGISQLCGFPQCFNTVSYVTSSHKHQSHVSSKVRLSQTSRLRWNHHSNRFIVKMAIKVEVGKTNENQRKTNAVSDSAAELNYS